MIKLFTHTDLDGVGCSILAQLICNNVDISYCDYDNIDSKVQKYLSSKQENTTPIFITDISVQADTAQLLNKRGNVKLFDHHPTALELNQYNWCHVEIEDADGIKTSGTMLFYQWLKSNGLLGKVKNNVSVEKFVELVRNYDTWRWTTLGEEGHICKQINDLFYLYGREDFIEWCLSEIHRDNFPCLYLGDQVVLKCKQKEIDNYISSKEKTMIIKEMCDYTCGIIFAEQYFSELGNQLCENHPEIDFIVMIDMAQQHISYRTVKSIDLGKEIASLFGGGGHPKSAGSSFQNSIRESVFEDIFGTLIHPLLEYPLQR